jgi:CheY-like chemotaxis protein
VRTWRQFCRSKAYRVATAANGEEALAVARQEHPRLILLDLMMPQMDGFAFRAAQLRDPTLAKIPVILTSAVEDDAAIARLGLLGEVRKPIDVDQAARTGRAVLRACETPWTTILDDSHDKARGGEQKHGYQTARTPDAGPSSSSSALLPARTAACAPRRRSGRLRQREGEDGVAGRDREELPAVDGVADGRGANRGAVRHVPQVAPRVGVERDEVTLAVAGEHQAPGRRGHAGPRAGELPAARGVTSPTE